METGKIKKRILPVSWYEGYAERSINYIDRTVESLREGEGMMDGIRERRILPGKDKKSRAEEKAASAGTKDGHRLQNQFINAGYHGEGSFIARSMEGRSAGNGVMREESGFQREEPVIQRNPAAAGAGDHTTKTAGNTETTESGESKCATNTCTDAAVPNTSVVSAG